MLLAGCASNATTYNQVEVPLVTEASVPTEPVPPTEQPEIADIEEPVEPEPTEPQIVEKYPTVPQFFQTDYLDTPYGKYGSVATHGCGIASLSMVASYLLDTEILPDELAAKYGRYNTDGGSDWRLFPKAAEDLGIVMEEQTWSIKKVKEGLREGKVAIANAREGSPFTGGGHFIALTGITEDGRILVNDPYKGNYKSYSKSELREGFEIGFETSSFKCCNQYWIFSAKDDAVITNTEKTTSISYEFIENEGMLPYYVYTPSVVNEEEKTPLIVWLHDSWETDLTEIAFTNIGLPNLLNNWSLNEPNAYIVCPQLVDKAKSWHNTKAVYEQVESAVYDFISTHNVDPDKIIIMGQGIGGNASLSFSSKTIESFSAAIVLSANSSKNVEFEELRVPTKAFVGSVESGESPNSVSFAKKLIEHLGDENVFSIETSTAGLLREVLFEDSNNNNESDVLEWALAQ